MPGFKERVEADRIARAQREAQQAQQQPDPADAEREALADAHYESAVARIMLAIQEKGHVAFQEKVTDLVTDAGANAYLVDAALALLGSGRCETLGHFELPGTGKCAWCGASIAPART